MDRIDVLATAGEAHDCAIEMRFALEAAERGLAHERHESWPAEPHIEAQAVGGALLATRYNSAHYSQAIWSDGESLALVAVSSGTLHVTAVGESPERAAQCVQAVREILPPYQSADPEVLSADPEVLPVTFWTMSSHGARSLVRELDSVDWTQVEENYPDAAGIGELMRPDFRPGVGGQLILWHGDPGTGKTTALRALARQWRDWCELHYVVDPETFFGSRADYMLDVLTSESESKTIYVGDHESEPTALWKLIVLEDCGELLAPDAKREVGQALARLLNACDGLIGRGLRILVLLTTNEGAEKLHDAVARPGRCAARVEFKTFSVAQASRWLDAHGVHNAPACAAQTLADLYGLVNGFRTEREHRPVGFAA